MWLCFACSQSDSASNFSFADGASTISGKRCDRHFRSGRSEVGTARREVPGASDQASLVRNFWIASPMRESSLAAVFGLAIMPTIPTSTTDDKAGV